MKKILCIAPLPPPVHGSAMMTQYIKDSKLINESFNLDWVNLSTSRRMDEIGKRNPIKIWRFLASYLKTFWKLATNKYDACYLAITCHGGGFIKDAPFVLLCKLFKNRIVIHQHNKGMANDVDRPIYKWLFPLVYRNVTVILLSWRLYPDIEKVVTKDQVKICPNGIPATKVYPKNPLPHIPQILFLSNLIESKGVFILLDALKILKDEGYVFRCKFIGGETKEIDANRFNDEVRKRGLDERINYLGKKYGEVKHEILAQSDILTFPTFNETFGLVLLEAMQQATPVVTTDVGGIPDIIKDGENGLICKQKDIVSLAHKIKELLDSPEKAKNLGIKGRENFLKKYTLEKWEQSLLFNIQQITTGGGKYVEFLGKKYGEEKWQEYSNSDIFVFPTFYENECFPLVVLEAMQQAVPVISTEEGGIPDIIENGETGLIVKSKSSEDLAKAISLLLDNPDFLVKFGKSGYEMFKSKFTHIQFERNIINCLAD